MPQHRTRHSADTGRSLTFFKPDQFHFQPPNLRVVTLRTGGRILGLGAAFGIEDARCLCLQLLLPLPDLSRMPLEFLDDLIHRLGASDRFNRYLVPETKCLFSCSLNVLKSVIVFRFGDATHLILHGSVPPPPLACVLCATIQDFGHKTSSCKDENMQGAFSVAQKVDVFASSKTSLCRNL